MVLVELPAGRKDVGDCTRAEAWAAVASALVDAIGDPAALADMLPRHARIDVLTGNMWPTPRTLKRMGSSVAVAYGETDDDRPVVSVVASDGLVFAAWEGELNGWYFETGQWVQSDGQWAGLQRCVPLPEAPEPNIVKVIRCPFPEQTAIKFASVLAVDWGLRSRRGPGSGSIRVGQVGHL